MSKCPAFYAFNGKGVCTPVPCGQWSCPHCAKHLARLWAWRAKLQVNQSEKGRYWFWTLTMRGKYHSAQSAFKVLPRLWDTFRKAVQRQLKKKGTPQWSYLAFVEGQPKRDYMPHFHILSSAKSPKRLKDMAMEAGFGFEAYEKPVDGAKAMSYVAKYASKQGQATPKRFRRVRATRDWAKLPPFDGDPLFVKARNEPLTDYLLRVNSATGVDMDTLLDRWSLAQMRLENDTQGMYKSDTVT